ncbi:MFS transporter [Paraburkholderia sp. D15]|uniref:MFS transporter n=1 Tax=Paraburkholderia sp. D15 TaxID=2880218 RepID=UPI002479F1B9|nr:MFS transporter [Paraburkholderia sp. D15]WGS53268.1 MFS transporter [Paraburkholderia sp. D15]
MVVQSLLNRNRGDAPAVLSGEQSAIELPRAYRRSWYILLVAWVAYFIDLFMRYNIPTVIPILQRENGWSASTIGWIDASFLIAYAVGQLPWGVVSERWLGARWTVTLGTGLIAFASIAFAVHANSVALAILARALIGLGAAAVWVPVNPMLARWFSPALRGTQTGLMAMGGALGTGAGGALMPVLITGSVSLFGLSMIQSGFLYSAIPGLIMIVVVPLVLRDKPEQIGLISLDGNKSKAKHAEPDVDASMASFWNIMKHSRYPYVLTVSYTGFIACKYFVWTWFAAFLVSTYQIKIGHAGYLWAFVAAVPAALCQPLAGLASDRFGHRRSLMISLSIVALICLLFVSYTLLGPRWVPAWVVLATAVLFSIFVNMWIIVWPLTTTLFPTTAAGPIGGLMNTVAQICGSLAPVVSGYFIDVTHSYVGVFVAGMVCALVGISAARLLPVTATAGRA